MNDSSSREKVEEMLGDNLIHFVDSISVAIFGAMMWMMDKWDKLDVLDVSELGAS